MDTQIQQSARPSSFVKAGGAAAVPARSWFDANRSLILRVALAVVVIVVVAVVLGAYITTQSVKAESSFSEAMDVYDAPLRQPGQPVDPTAKTFATAAERGQAANPLFTKIADRYGLFKAGATARYFAGLTAADMGRSGEAEADLKKAADGHDGGLSSLAKLALAGFYRRNGQQQRAIDLYQQLIAKPTLTVPASTARLQLAEAYEATRPDEARKLYAQIKDQDKTSAAAQIASQKLDGKK